MAEFYLVRHGQASFGADNYDQLSLLGEQQAYWLGQYFAERGISFDQVLLGTQVRHRQTAEAIFKGLGSALPLQHHAGLNEYDFYALNSALRNQFPELAAFEGQGKKAFYRALKQALGLWSQNRLEGLPETWQMFVDRIGKAIEAIKKTHAKCLLVVTSGGPIAAVIQQTLQCPTATAIQLNMQVRNTSFCHYYFNNHTLRLASFNNIPHLDLPHRIGSITYG